MRAKLNADGSTLNWVVKAGMYEIGIYLPKDGELKANLHKGDDLVAVSGGAIVEHLARHLKLRRPDGRLLLPAKGPSIAAHEFVRVATLVGGNDAS